MQVLLLVIAVFAACREPVDRAPAPPPRPADAAKIAAPAADAAPVDAVIDAGAPPLDARPVAPDAGPRLGRDGDVCRTFPPHESTRPCGHGLRCCSIYGVASASLVCKPVCGPGRP